MKSRKSYSVSKWPINVILFFFPEKIEETESISNQLNKIHQTFSIWFSKQDIQKDTWFFQWQSLAKMKKKKLRHMGKFANIHAFNLYFNIGVKIHFAVPGIKR